MGRNDFVSSLNAPKPNYALWINSPRDMTPTFINRNASKSTSTCMKIIMGLESVFIRKVREFARVFKFISLIELQVST